MTEHGSVKGEALNGDTLDVVHPDGSIISDSSSIDKSLLNPERSNIDVSTQSHTEFVRVDDDESIPDVVAGNVRKTGSISGMKKISENVDDTNLIPLSRSDKSSTRSEVRNKSTRKSTTSKRRTKEEFHMMSDFEANEVNNVTETSLGIPPSRISVISEETPIPNSDASLRLLRKFANKTRAHIPQEYGGTKPKSILRYLFGTSSQENKVSLTPYSDLMMIILPQAEALASYEESDIVVESVLGGSGDSMEKARLAIASFCHLLSVWCHASQSLEGKDPKSVELLAFAMDTATSIVAHGCLDDVDLILSRHRLPAVQIMVESVIVTDLSKERAELASLKFLLTTGCRNTSKGESLLKGQHLLQAIRVLYHIFLTTESEANKTTARASLQQLVSNVFRRMSTSKGSDLSEGFPSNNHRDAFLVLRSLCKLSMRNLPESGHSGLSITGSSAAWDGGVQESSTPAKHNVDGLSHDKIQTVTVHPIHPALESKILALELLLYVLQNTDMSGNFLRHSGPQFQYAIRNYLCVSLLKNCMSENTTVVNLSLRLFVPIIRNFRSHLKTEIEAFVTNVFFVILDSKHSTLEHKNLVVVLFEEICSDPQTLAEIFLNYDCDLSAVDLFHRIVNTLSRVAKNGIQDEGTISSMSFVAGAGAARMERLRIESRELRLEAMRALRHVLASLHASIVEPMKHGKSIPISGESNTSETPEKKSNGEDERTLVEIYDSKKKRRAEESEAILRFNQKPSSGIKYAHQCGHIDGNDAMEVAKYLLKNKDFFDKTQIGEFLGREPAYQNGFALKVLHEYATMFDFEGLVFDDAIKYFLSGFRLPGEAQKIDRIMEKFAERFTEQNPNVFPNADAAFILAFSIIMLNTDLHNPAIKEERRMTKEGFIRNNRGICDGQDLPEEMLISIFDRIKKDPISLKEDDEARLKYGGGLDSGTSIQTALSPAVFFNSHYEDLDKNRENNFQKERDQIVRTTESLLRRKRNNTSCKEGDGGSKNAVRYRSTNGKPRSMRYVRTEDTGLRDEYVAPMFEVTWGPALAAFSTAMESANGSVGALLSIASDEELEHAAENAAETIEVCLTGFRFAVCTAGLCGNETARDAYMLALSRFTQLGSGSLLEPRHVRCIQTLLSLGKDDGELLGNTWEHVFKSLSEINRFHELFHVMARNDRAAAIAENRRRQRLEELERRRSMKEEQQSVDESGESGDSENETDVENEEGSMTDEEIFSDDEFIFDEEMDNREIDEANARVIYDAVSEAIIEAIYQRSASLSAPSIKHFIFQLCRVSRMEISGYGGHAGSDANTVDLTHVHYRQQHTLLGQGSHGSFSPYINQPNIYNLQKLVEVTHYNMDSRPRLVFSDIWTTVAAHLTSTALHSNAAVAMYAVDSFRQLSIQYLQREELGGFEFQRKFLKSLETVMAKGSHVSVKELLLKCVERIIMVFGSKESIHQSGEGNIGTLRSGWRPILAVLGLAGTDEDERIAKLGFKMVTSQLRQCLSIEKDDVGIDKVSAGVLLAERFIDLVDALLSYVKGPHEELSLISIDHLVTLTTFLADESFALPLVRKRSSLKGKMMSKSEKGGGKEPNELELWWPILLGFARSIGDDRKKVRLKSMVTLLAVINEHFFVKEASSVENTSLPSYEDIQTLQLIFRGILTPVLEYADVDTCSGPPPPLPNDFERFATKPPQPLSKGKRNQTWLETTFELFMDGCIGLCMRSIEVYKDDSLIEEIFSMLNSCTSSDSGGLAVRGLLRLQQFVTDDLNMAVISDEIWATVCHILRRCLSVRGLPVKGLETGVVVDPVEGNQSVLLDYEEAIREFITEEKVMQDRRYIGSNVTKIIVDLILNEKYASSMTVKWSLFLTNGLGRGIKEWEEAGTILANQKHDSAMSSPPNYIENAIYGRKSMNKLLVHFTIMSSTDGPKAQIQAIVRDQIQSLFSLFQDKESVLSKVAKAPSWEASQLTRITKLIYELIRCFEEVDDDNLVHFNWLDPVILKCMESKNDTLRRSLTKFQHRLAKVCEKHKNDDSTGLSSTSTESLE